MMPSMSLRSYCSSRVIIGLKNIVSLQAIPGLIDNLTLSALDAKSACLFASLSRGNVSCKNLKKVCGNSSKV